MSEIKLSGTTVIDNTSGTVTVDANQLQIGNTTVIDNNKKLTNVDIVPNSSFMFRNKIINGGMQIAQRGNSTSVSATSYRACDRYHFVITNGGTWSISQSTDSPPGFGSSYKLECTAAKSSLDSDSRLLIIHKIEGQNLQDLKKGTAGAESVTLSFYVKTSLAGTYQVNLEDNDNIRIIGNTYTIASNEVNTWQYKTFTFAGDTTGVLDNDNMDSLSLHFVLVAGTDNSTGSLPTAWEAKSNTDRGAGLTVNLAATIGNTWQIAGVQLEIGTAATPFEHRPIGMELSLCQRYTTTIGNGYFAGNGAGSAAVVFGVPLCVPLRAAPSIEKIGGANINIHRSGNNTNTNATVTVNAWKENATMINLRTSHNSITDEAVYNLYINNTFLLKSEL